MVRSGWVQQMNDTLQNQQREQERKDSPDGAAGQGLP
jgi:hypothetical protein